MVFQVLVLRFLAAILRRVVRIHGDLDRNAFGFEDHEQFLTNEFQRFISDSNIEASKEE